MKREKWFREKINLTKVQISHSELFPSLFLGGLHGDGGDVVCTIHMHEERMNDVPGRENQRQRDAIPQRSGRKGSSMEETIWSKVSKD